MKSAPPPQSRVCLYCGLPSSVTSHGNVGECVDALQHEVARLTDHLRQGKPGVPVEAQGREADVSGYANKRRNLVPGAAR